jgi:hypothetical protein
MTSFLLALLVLLPALPGTTAVGRAFTRKDRRWAKLGIRWAAVTAMTAGVILAMTYVRLFGAVAAADPSEKPRLLAAGLAVVQPAVRLGAGLACVLGLLGGVARGLAPEDEQRPPGR